jgi:hypothetical protein
MNIRKAALIATVAQMLWSLQMIAPQVLGYQAFLTDGPNKALFLFEPFALVIFFSVVYWQGERLRVSIQVRIAALIAALCLGVENVLPAYGAIRGVVISSRYALAWRYHPFGQLRYVLAPTIPTISVISVIAFLIVVYQKSPRLTQLDETEIEAHEYIALRIAAILVFVANIVAMGQLIFFVFSSPISQTPGFGVRFALRLLSLGSLATFFFFVAVGQQRVNYESPAGDGFPVEPSQ